MKRKIKVYTAIETGEIELINILELDIKKDKTIRNIDKLNFHDDLKFILKVDEDLKEGLMNLVNQLYPVLKDGDISIFRNFRYNRHKEDTDIDLYHSNNLMTFFENGDAKHTYLQNCIYEMKNILFNPDIYDSYKLGRIDLLIFLFERIVNLTDNRENFINNIQLTNALKEEFPDLSEGEYRLIKKRLFVLIDIFHLCDDELESPYIKEIEECKIHEEDSLIQKYIKLNRFNDLITTK